MTTNFQYTSLGYFTVAKIVQPHSIFLNRKKKNAPSLSEKNHILATERKPKQNPQNYTQQKPTYIHNAIKKSPLLKRKLNYSSPLPK